jgi:23S rRNA (guanosine2251-2'-O)-methyltransferase
MALKRGDIETNAFEVRSFDAVIPLEQYRELPKLPLYFVLDNLRSAFNVGVIFRLCDALRVSGLLLCGYTAHPPHLKLEKTSLGTVNFVPWQHFTTTLDAVAWLRERKVPVWAAETCSHAKAYYEVEWPRQVAIVMGNEALGVSRHVLDVCDQVVEIPLYGFKNSVNVAAAAAVVGFRFAEMIGPESVRAPMPSARKP